MSGGMWFIICIPTEIYEKQLLDSVVKKNESEGSYQTLSAYKTSSTDTFSTAYSHSESEEGLKNVQERHEKNDIIINIEDTEIPSRKPSTKLLRPIPENEKKKEDEKNDDQSEESEHLVSFVDKDMSLEKVLKDSLDSFGIIDAVWTSAREGKFHQISFPCEPGYKSDVILRALIAKGIGIRGGSTLGVVPCAVFYQDIAERETQTSNAGSDGESEGGSEESLKSKSEAKKNKSCSKAVQHKFLKSVTARLTVAQVVEGVRANAHLTFDFVTFVIVASIIAAVGLVENSYIILVASMLISPLMGPILAGTFGTIIKDDSLRNLGVKTEAVGLLLCLLAGALFGIVASPFDQYWTGHTWPTPEMISRGVWRSVATGFVVALCSGAGVALSVVGGTMGPVVGVAISASLLPPAVNAGLLWTLSVVKAIKAINEKETILVEENTTSTWLKPSLAPPPGYKMIYASTMDTECAVLGAISLSLTLINIICIFVTALLFLKIKEVAPHTSIPQIRRFWKKDIKIARDYNKTLEHQDARTLGKQFLMEWANLNNLDPKEVFNQSHQAKLTQLETLKDIVNDVEADDVYQTVVRYVPNAAPQALSRCINLITWPAPEVTFSTSRPSVWELGFSAESSSDIALGKESLFRSSDYHQINHVPSSKNRFLSKKKMKMPTWSVDTMSCWPLDSYSDLDIKNKQRNSSMLVTTVNSCHSEGYLRPAASSQNPYTLWPSSWLKSSRFVVTPVTEMDRSPPRSFLGKGLPSSNLDTVTTC